MFNLPLMITLPVLLAAPAALAVAVPAHADDTWIVMAVSQSSGEEVVRAGTGNTYTATVRAAVNECNQKAHVTDCLIVAQGQGGCVAAATPGLPNTIRGAWASTRQAAVSAALAQAYPGSHVIADCVGDPGLQGQ